MIDFGFGRHEGTKAHRHEVAASVPPCLRAAVPFRRRGFTVLELVTVMAIIAILISLLVVGVGHVVTSNKIKQTHVMLQNCRNLMAEMEVNNGLNQQPPILYVGGGQVPYSTTSTAFDLWHAYKYVDYTGNTGTYGALYASAANKFGTGVAQGLPGRYNSDAILNTRLAMAILQQIPNNKTAMSNIPANQFLEAPPGGLASLTPQGVTFGPVILDGFGNPIILVPAAGIQVTVSDPANSGQAKTMIIRAPDKRPFWASAGPDGFFTDVNGKKPYGEDNIYSFEQ